VEIQVYDKERLGKDEKIGHASVALKANIWDGWLKLANTRSGQVRVRVEIERKGAEQRYRRNAESMQRIRQRLTVDLTKMKFQQSEVSAYSHAKCTALSHVI